MIRQFIGHSAVYAIGTLFSQGLAVVLFPLYTRIFSPEDYGIIDLVTVATILLSVILTLEISQSLGRHYADSKTIEERRAYASTTLWFTFFVYSGVVLIAFIFAEPIGWFLFSKHNTEDIVRAATISLWASGILYILQQQLRWQLMPGRFVIVGMVTAFTSAAVTVVFLVVLNTGVIGIFLGQFAGFSTAGALALWWSRSIYLLHVDTKRLREMLLFSLPLVPSSVGFILATYIDRLAIKKFLSLSDVGLYGAGFRVASVVGIALLGFQSAITPLVLKHYRDKHARWHMAQMFRYFVTGGLILVLALSIFAPELLALLAPRNYRSGASVVPLLVPATILFGMYVFAPGLIIRKRTRLYGAIGVGAGVLNVSLAFSLVPLFGILGAGFASLVSGAMMFGAFMFVSQRLYYVPHNWSRLAMATVLTMPIVIGCAVGDWYDAYPTATVAMIAIKLLLTLTGTLAVCLTLIRRDELNTVRSLLHSRFFRSRSAALASNAHRN